MTARFDLSLERAAAGDVDDDELREVERSPEGARALAELRADNERILAALPPDRIAAEIARRRSARVVRVKPVAGRARFAVVVAACVVALVVIRPGASERIKGDAVVGTPGLTVWRQVGAQAERLTDGARVVAGDLVQLTYASGGHKHGVVVSVDGAGAATLVFPASSSGDTTLRAEAALPFSLEIDDAPGFERFVFVVADAPLDPGRVLQAARALALDPRARAAPLVVEGAAQTSLLLVKESR